MENRAATRPLPVSRPALLLAFAGIGLVGYLVGGWFAGSPDKAAGSAIYGPAPIGQSIATPITLVLATLSVALAVSLSWRSRRKAPQSSLRDPLSGLFTAAYVDEALPRLMARDDRNGRSQLALVRVGLDSIEDVRRRYGAAAADKVLAAAGRHIASQTRDCDLPVEPDAQGFSVFLHCEDAEQAAAFCRRLSTLLHSEQLDWRGDAIKVSTHMGIAVRKLGEPVEQLTDRATSNQQLAAGSVPGQVVA